MKVDLLGGLKAGSKTSQQSFDKYVSEHGKAVIPGAIGGATLFLGSTIF